MPWQVSRRKIAKSFSLEHCFSYTVIILPNKGFYQLPPPPSSRIPSSYHILWLPLPSITILINSSHFTHIIQTIQDLRNIGKLKQRWEEIKKLQTGGYVDCLRNLNLCDFKLLSFSFQSLLIFFRVAAGRHSSWRALHAM